MPVTNTWGPPSIAGSIDSFVDTALGGIKDYQTGQLLDRLPKTADGSIDYQAAAAAMYRTNPGLAAQFLKMDELRGLQSYRKRSLDIQEKALEEKGEVITGEGKHFVYGPGKVLRGWTDIETGVWTPAGRGQAGPQAGPRELPKEAIDILKSRPDTAPQFEKTFGLPPGGAKQYLEGGGTTAPAPQAQAGPPSATPPPAAPPPAPLPALPPGLSYTEKKEARKGQLAERVKVDQGKLKETDDMIQSGLTSLPQIAEIIKLNKSAFQGPGAELRGNIAALTGIGGKQAGVDTLVLQNKMTSGMLEQLRATFGGNPTEGEQKVLAKVTGSVTQPSAVRDEIFKEALHTVRRRIKHSQKYANAQRQGQYMDPNYTDNTPVD